MEDDNDEKPSSKTAIRFCAAEQRKAKKTPSPRNRKTANKKKSSSAKKTPSPKANLAAGSTKKKSPSPAKKSPSPAKRKSLSPAKKKTPSPKKKSPPPNKKVAETSEPEEELTTETKEAEPTAETKPAENSELATEIKEAVENSEPTTEAKGQDNAELTMETEEVENAESEEVEPTNESNENVELANETKERETSELTTKAEEADKTEGELTNETKAEGKPTSEKKASSRKRPPPPTEEDIKKEQTAHILQAVDVVDRSLITGPWPSPVKSLVPRCVRARTHSEIAKHAHHMSLISVSLRQFTVDVVIPTMTAYRADERDDLRCFLGTLLILREVLTRNVQAIFGSSGIPTGAQDDFPPQVRLLSQSHALREEAALFSARVLATAVIVHGLEISGRGRLTDDFLYRADLYDRGDAVVANQMIPISPEDDVCTPAGGPLPASERMAWQSSYNFQLEKHPIRKELHGEVSNTQEAERKKPVRLARSNAVHISVIEELH